MANPSAINNGGKKGAHYRKAQEEENHERHKGRLGKQPSAPRGGQEWEGPPAHRPRTDADPLAAQMEEQRKEAVRQGYQEQNKLRTGR